MVDSTNIYVNYFYKSKYASDCILNDSSSVFVRKISTDKLYLDKYVNKKKIWRKVYQIELAKDSLHITTKIDGGTGKNSFKYSKKPFYNTILISN